MQEWHNRNVTVIERETFKDNYKARKESKRHYTLVSYLRCFSDFWGQSIPSYVIWEIKEHVEDILREYEVRATEFSRQSAAKVYSCRDYDPKGDFRLCVGLELKLEFERPSDVPDELPEECFEEICWYLENYVFKELHVERPPVMTPIEEQVVAQFLDCFTHGLDEESKESVVCQLKRDNFMGKTCQQVYRSGKENWEDFQLAVGFSYRGWYGAQREGKIVKSSQNDEPIWWTIEHAYSLRLGGELTEDEQAGMDLTMEVMLEVQRKLYALIPLQQRLGVEKLTEIICRGIENLEV